MLGTAIMNLGNVAYSTGDFQTGLDHGLAAVDLFRKIGIDFEMALRSGTVARTA